MNTSAIFSLIIPAYNEVRVIGQTVAEAVHFFEERQMNYEIIVSADGEDGTRELIAQLYANNPRIYAIGTPQRGGKGKGIRSAVALAQGRWIGFTDADNKTPISELDHFLPYLYKGIEVTIGSRGDPQSKIERPQPWFRRIGAWGFRIFMHTITGLWEIRDTQCGFKFFQGKVAKDLFARQQIDGYMYDVEILYLAKKTGYRIEQIPVRWRDDGDSRLQLVRGNIRNFMDVLRIRFGLGKRQPERAGAFRQTPVL
jgi:dolichyl-phosphate beta-glucosyltransferase